ncbi:TonB-dependent receptor [Leptothoe sp. LEGE 181152]|nr:TonB-dependent receptor [Leptothoe sp. LEGE 181152]
MLSWHLPARAQPDTTGTIDNEAGAVTLQLAQDSQPEPEPSDPSQTESLRILVTGDNNIYYAPETSTGIVTPILENPQSIQVIPRQVLDDQQVLGLDEALRNIGGASVSSTEGRGFQVNLRGFAGVPVFRDGFRLFSPNGNGDAAGQNFPEIANIERIEVLRGPASAQFGQIGPGGAVNVVTKKPLETPFAEAEFQIGNNGLLRPRVDVSGPLSDNGDFLYRLNAVYTSEDGFRDFDQDTEQFFISPALTWNINDRTDLNLQLEYLNEQRPLDTGLVAFGDGLADIPRDRVLGELDDEISSDYFSAGYTLEHRFNDNWQLRNAFRYIRDADDISAAPSFPFIGGLDETTGTLNRVFGEQKVSNTTYALQTNAVGEFSTGPIDHTLLLGIDLARYELKSESFTDFSLRTPINIFDPVYVAVARPERSDEILSGDTIDTDSLRLYVQDQIKLTNNLSLVAGLSYETTEQTTTNLIDETESTLNDDAFTPLIGIVYQPLETVSLYANYARSFLPNSAVTISGDPLEPEEGEGFEVGIKTELLDRRLLATLAYFNLTKQNVATADPTNPRFSVATGEQQSQGIELDIIGEIAPGWNIIGSYAYIDTEVTEDNRFDPGNRLPGIPEHSASLWTTYEIQSGDLSGLSFGLGFNWVGERQGDLANSFELDSYFLTNAAISYQRDDWRFALNFKNLFDVDYITGAPRTRTRGIEPGDPFSVVGSFSYRF